MKKLFSFLTFTFLLLNFEFTSAQNVCVGTNNPDPSAKFEVNSTNSGFLPPRMTFTQRTAISNPATGLIVWCTDCGSGELSIFTGTDWKSTIIGNFSNVTQPSTPANLNVTVSSASDYTTLNWTDNSTNEIGYKIERKNGNGIFTNIGQVGTNVSTFNDSSIAYNTIYTYRVYAYNYAGNSAQYSNEFQITTYGVPTVTTNDVTSITNTTATCGGNVTFDGNTSVIARGICWSTSPNPTTALSTKTVDGTGTGSFTSSLTGLTANTTYYVRAYATNSVGTTYGAQQTFTTTNITFVSIGTQIWSSQNLSVATYRNGDPIPQVTDPTAWANRTTGAWCWYNNDSATYAATYGRLYNWYAVNDPRGLAPQGWHVPTNSEWDKMTKYLDPTADTTQYSSNVAGTAMKSTTGWYNNGNGTNSSGFSGLPGGLRDYDGTFYNVGNYGYWWSASAFDTTSACVRYLYYNNSNVYRSNGNKTYGFSVRVVRD